MKKIIPFLLTLCILLSSCTSPKDTTEFTAAASVPPADTLTVHFIDVGQADCALIEYGDYHILIDGGNREDGELIVSYLQQQDVSDLDAVICTHPHEDHVGGLPAVLAVYPTAAVYAPTKTYSSAVFDDFAYYVDQQGREIVIPEPGSRIDAGNLHLTFLGPVKSYAETNDTSLVCRIEYEDASFLFTGDMETAAENDMLDYWDGDIQWECDVLKVGHHGSDSSTGYRFLYETNPTYAVISCGRDNSYGHPHEEPLSRLQDADVTLFRTDEMGTILASTDGSEILFHWDNQDADPENAIPVQPSAESYIGNVNSKKFHAPDCANLPKEENRILLPSYEEALAQGYSPCGNCLE